MHRAGLFFIWRVSVCDGCAYYDAQQLPSLLVAPGPELRGDGS